MARGGRDPGVPDGDMVAEEDAQPRIAFGRGGFGHVLHGSADREALAEGARMHRRGIRPARFPRWQRSVSPPAPRPTWTGAEGSIHGSGAGGATAASRWPLLSSARATNPESFISSMNSRR